MSRDGARIRACHRFCEGFQETVNTRLPHRGHVLHTIQRQHAAAHRTGDTMTTAKLCAAAILSALADVQSELVGKAVVLADGIAGTVDDVCLDELHGLRISIKGHHGKWPISTIKFEQERPKP
jgi:hypothetical protein